MADAILSPHLPHEQEGIGPHGHPPRSGLHEVRERRYQPAIFGHVVRRLPQGALELGTDRAVWRLDSDAVAGRAGIAARSAVNVGHERRTGRHGWSTVAVPPGGSTKCKIRLQLSH